MRQSIASYCFIKAKLNDDIKYLMQLNEHRQTFNFISGHYEHEKDESFLATMIREVEEELPGLSHQHDFILVSLSDTPFRATHFSERFKELTQYEFHLFYLTFLKDLVDYEYLWTKNTNNEWFSLQEILNGISKKGLQITRFPTVALNEYIDGGLEAIPLSI